MKNIMLKMKIFLVIGQLVFMSNAHSDVPSVRFDKASDSILITVDNECKVLSLVPLPGCATTDPAQTGIRLVIKDLAADAFCKFTALDFVSLPASELSCRPAVVTIVGPNGPIKEVFVPAKD